MKLRTAGGDPAEIASDALVLTHFQGEPLGPLAETVDKRLDGLLASSLRGGAAGAAFPDRTIFAGVRGVSSARVVLLGLGRRSQLDGYRLRNALHFVARDLREYCPRLTVAVEDSVGAAVGALDHGQGRAPAVARALVEGVVLGNHHLGEFKSHASAGAVEELTLVGLGESSELTAAMELGELLAERTNRTRQLQWRPSNQLTPTQLAAAAEQVASEAGLEFEVLEREDMERLGMGALLAVARGSHQPPKLVVLRYRAKGAAKGPTLGLAGKGITFDSGGISLKPNAGMLTMKADMSGAAAVIEAMGLIAAQQAPISVIGVAPLTENMPGGGAIKPGDVVSAMNGKTIEINNTDAEGRLVLSDALCYLVDQGATHLVDVATLTGAVVVALGHAVSGAMGSDPELLGALRRAGAFCGERIWELPIYPEHDICLSCDIADMANTQGTPGAGSINGGVFLQQFTSGRPWVHLDIAGSAYHQEAKLVRLVPKGPSGVMTRSLARLPFELAGAS